MNDANADTALLAAAKRGDRQAFARMVREHQRAVYGYLFARLSDPTDAEDLTQEVFLRCYQGRGELGRAAAVRPWLIGIARNVLREHIRRLQRRQEVTWTELCLAADRGEPEDEGDEALDHLPVCIESLGKSARDALDLRYHSRLKLAEIGKRMRRSEGAVKLLMFRARQALKSCLTKRLK